MTDSKKGMVTYLVVVQQLHLAEVHVAILMLKYTRYVRVNKRYDTVDNEGYNQ